MTSTTGTTRHTARHTVRSVALTLAAAGLATAATAGLSLGPSLAQADPGDTYVPIGSSQLLQSEDVQWADTKLDTETVVPNRSDDFSSCLGEGNAWTDVLVGSPKPVAAFWSSRKHPNLGLSEYIAQAPTAAKAKEYYTTLLNQTIKDCQGNKSEYDFHYGTTESSGVGSGFATWALFYEGKNAKPVGGVAVIWKGTNFGFIEVGKMSAPAAPGMESVAKDAVHRLADVDGF